MSKYVYLTAAALSLLAVPVQAAPALWAVSDGDSTVYLFGTQHAVSPGTEWRTPALDAALKDAKTLWLEMKFPDPATSAALTQKFGLDPAKPLSIKLPAATAEKLKAFLSANGLPAQQVEAMRPWLAAVTVARVALMKSGLDAKAGADVTLKATAEAEGDKVDGFDTAEQQIRYLADLPESEQIAFLDKALDRAADKAVTMATAQAWEKGDLKSLDALINAEVKAQSKLLYDSLILNRNRRYADEIKTLLAGKETHLVAVGAGHLVGADGIPTMLAVDGVRVRRVQ